MHPEVTQASRVRLLGYDFTVRKAADVPRGAAVDADGTARLQAIASQPGDGLGLGSTQVGYAIPPHPGVLPDPTQEPTSDVRRFQFPWGANISYQPRTGYGTPFSILRTIAATSPVVQLCIQTRKDQMAALDWTFAPKDKKAKSTAIDAQKRRLEQLFAKPDLRTPFKAWLQMMVDEILTIDALSIYKRPTKKGAGRLQAAKTTRQRYQLQPDEIAAYEIIDGSTFKVLLDERGQIPAPPAIAFRQILYGAPVIAGDCTADELLYCPKTVRTWTPYGLSPIEAALMIVTADLNRALFNAAYYTDGNIPEAMAGVPDTWGPKQIQEWREYWDLLTKGDPQNRSKIWWVVQTMAKSIHEFKKPDFTTQYDLWLLKLQCACFGVTPSEIGFTDDVNRATSKTQGDVNQRRGIKPMANFLKGILDAIIALDLAMPDMEIVWSGGEGEDALVQAKIIDLNLRNGRLSLDEQRAIDGNPTIGAGPAIIGPNGPIFWEDAIAQSEAAGVLDTAGDDEPDEPLPPASATADPPPGDDAKTAALHAELKKYQRVATKAVRGGEVVPAFTTRILPARLHADLIRALASVETVEDVHKVFAQARTRVLKAQRLSATQKQAQKRLHRRLTTVFSEMKRELGAHVARGLEASS